MILGSLYQNIYLKYFYSYLTREDKLFPFYSKFPLKINVCPFFQNIKSLKEKY